MGVDNLTCFENRTDLGTTWSLTRVLDEFLLVIEAPRSRGGEVLMRFDVALQLTPCTTGDSHILNEGLPHGLDSGNSKSFIFSSRDIE